jgi:hypothetical protein
LDLEALANIGEFVSGIVVVVSLIYLAVQVRQNTESLRGESHARALDRISAMQAELARDGELSFLHSRGVLDVSLLTPAERIRFSWWLFEAFGAFEFMFLQARSGALQQEVWDRWAATTAWWLSFPGVRAWWAARPAPFSKSFSAFVDDCIRDNPADPASSERWQAFVRGGGPGASPHA